MWDPMSLHRFMKSSAYTNTSSTLSPTSRNCFLELRFFRQSALSAIIAVCSENEGLLPGFSADEDCQLTNYECSNTGKLSHAVRARWCRISDTGTLAGEILKISCLLLRNRGS